MPDPKEQPPPSTTPPPDIQSTAPRTLGDVVGQKRAVQQLEVALAAYRRDADAGRPSAFPHVLLDGPPGVGKSLLASVVARELNAKVTELLGQSLDAAEDVHAALVEATDHAVLFVDECHLASVPAQTSLLRALEDRVLLLPTRGVVRPDGGRDIRHISIPLPPFTLVLATTDPQKLLAPLRDRIALSLHLAHYEAADLATLSQRRADGLGWSVDPIVHQHIGRCAKGSARGALRLLQACHRVSRARGCDRIAVGHFVRVGLMEGLDPVHGLDETQQRYLRILSESPMPVRISVIASRLGLPAKQVSEVVEPYLLRAELVVRLDNGRHLTDRGRIECHRLFGGLDE